MRLKLLFLLYICFFAINAKNVSFSYDNVGNRVKREIIVEKKAAPSRETANPEYFSEMLSEKEIRIYPNPTDGFLKIEISGYEDSDECSLSIFNMSGQQLQRIIVTTPLTDIDITTQTNGLYIFHIVLNGEDSTWKIIKR